MSFRMSSASGTSGLLRCPKNLKECMDWLLCIHGQGKISELASAVQNVLGDSHFDSNDLTQLVHGLCLFLGYPSCVCSLKANVDKSLQYISGKLKGDFKAVQSCVSITTLNLNCSSCQSKNILCKCCVISCIKAVKKCKCVKNTSNSCQCKDPKGKCCKDVLSGLEACLSLLNLKTDMAACDCDGQKCCNNGVCTNGSCDLCSPKKFPDNAMTGLGICPMNPRKLAQKLEKFFGTNTVGSQDCSCTCNGSSPSCCCLACPDQTCSSQKSCFCLPNSKCSCDKAPKKPSPCPRKKFCMAIQNVKVLADSTEMTCCEGGKSCHCALEGSSKCSGSALNCCVVEDKSGSGSPAYYHSLKCLIRRLVKFFNGLSLDSSKKDCSKLCCELLCVLKTCEFLKKLFNDSKKWAGKKSCGKCSKGKGSGGNCLGSRITSSKCCNGTISGCKSPNCCQGCPECNAIKLGKALQKLQYSGPCGLDLYRVLNDFLNFCCNVFWPYVDKKEVKGKIEDARKKCLSGCSQKTGKPCSCSDCDGCKALRGHNDIMAMLRHGYVSSYVNSKWNSLCHGPSCPCQGSFPLSGSACPPGGCCPDCPQRKAAKIFLGMLPCLYYGLKILHARSKYGSGFAGWHDISILSDKPSSDLAKFLKAWGYDLRPLISKKGSEFFSLLENLFSSGSLNSLFETSKKYFSMNVFTPDPSKSLSPPKDPSTVRQMLLWLYGLRFQKHFSELVENCKSLCSPFGNSFHPDAFCYYIHTCCFLLPVAIISLIEDSLSITSLHSEFSKFSYPSDPSKLLKTL
ncbi:variant erythrocyte surface antigen-1 family protein [Babesia divergens]|uniref:Variant erythrocyte surface antigen-1 family protein n=1 Tax=Babesia divergens TaxID=32595 RepID=A0AAD9GMP6_BABDI|nr:variant erythrocyte surface antigen-1 family protein [Babesia divergens]